MSEWGNPACSDVCYPFEEANQGKWNISVPWGKEINRDSQSSGERNGNSPKLYRVLIELAGMLDQRGWKSRKWKLTIDYTSRSGHVKPWLKTGLHLSLYDTHNEIWSSEIWKDILEGLALAKVRKYFFKDCCFKTHP